MIKVFIECESGSNIKNRYDEQTLIQKQSFTIAQPYPYAYGFILNTSTEDGDALDCYVITKKKLYPGMTVECEILGMLEMFEDEEMDHKLLAKLPGEDTVLSPHLHQQLKEFILNIFSEFPEVTVRIGDFLSKAKTLDYLEKTKNED